MQQKSLHVYIAVIEDIKNWKFMYCKAVLDFLLCMQYARLGTWGFEEITGELKAPAGTLRAILFDFLTRPSPWQELQGVNLSPVPSQSAHCITCWKLPKGVLTGCMSCPEPPQVEHVLARVPAFTPSPSHVPHFSNLLTSSSLLHTWHNYVNKRLNWIFPRPCEKYLKCKSGIRWR